MSLRDPEFIESLEGFYSTSELKVSERLPSHTVRLNQPHDAQLTKSHILVHESWNNAVG